jgi:putative spermidine/putrescine transport system ATP-binding protein
MSRPILELRDVNKKYGLVQAVDGVSFELSRGEFLSLLGPSGSGKTTTLQMIAGLVRVSGGEILLDGQSINLLPPYKRDIGVVFQNYALFPHLTVARNIAFPLEMRGFTRSDIDRRVLDALKLVDLPNYGNRYPRELSGGQQQRVALARAFVFEPKLLLMDEPLGALDKKLREYMQVEIKRLHERLGATVIYVTHDQDEALVMSNRIAVFNNGKIEQIASPDEIYNRPATRFVAEFVGETNIFSTIKYGLIENNMRLKSSTIEFQVPNTFSLSDREVLVSIRPERVRVENRNNTIALENQLNGFITEVIYMGRIIRYTIQSEDQLVSIVAIAQVSSIREKVFKKGDPVTTFWDGIDVVPILKGNEP